MHHRPHDRPLAALLAIALLSITATADAQHRKTTLQETIALSDLVIVGEVTAIDESAGIPTGEAITRVDIAVERVLRGSAGKTHSITYRGGKRPDGLGESRDWVPHITVGDRYIMCLWQDYFITPFVRGESVMRVVRVGADDVAVDEFGYVVGASPTMGLMRGAHVASAAVERKQAEKNGRHREKETVSMATVPESAKAANVLALLEQMARSSMPVARAAKSNTRPKPLPVETFVDAAPKPQEPLPDADSYKWSGPRNDKEIDHE